MKVIISPGEIKGTAIAPPSKSIMQRACAAALLKKGSYNLHNAGRSADDEVMLRIIQQMGCSVSEEGGTVRIHNSGIIYPKMVDFGESGLAARMMIPILAMHDSAVVLDAAPSLRKRPMHFYEEVLPMLGVEISLNDGHLPGTIRGPMVPAAIEVDAGISSQVITGLIYGFTLADAQGARLMLRNLVSRPYVDLTLQVLKSIHGVNPVWADADTLYWEAAPRPSSAATVDYTIEGDWSGAAFLLVAGATAGPVTITGLDVFSEQADKSILNALMYAGASLSIQQEQIRVAPSSLKAFHFNATDCPDLFPPLAALAAAADGTSVIEGVSRLVHKESNRGMALQSELGKMGISVQLQDDLMIVEGCDNVNGAVVSSHDDHRIAMACGVAALRARGETIIQGAEAVNKSYPYFWKEMQSLGAQIAFAE